MNRYNLQVTVPSSGRYEVIKENLSPVGIQDEDYWEECFLWEDLKVIIPRMRAFHWKMKIYPVNDMDLSGKIHLFPFTYGVNHDVQMINISNIKLIMTRDMGLLNFPKHTFRPFGY